MSLEVGCIQNGKIWPITLDMVLIIDTPQSAREIQAQEGLTPIWGPPASGGSTPLRETIPESPSQDGFPDFVPPPENGTQSPARRVRAGTVPSRFSPGGGTPGAISPASLASKTSRPTPSSSPFRSSSLISNNGESNQAFAHSTSALLSRLRAGSMPQRSNYVETSSPFGSSLFSTNWSNGRERAPTLQSVRSTDTPDSPAQSSFSKDGLADTGVKTLDYLGLAETPQTSQANLVQPGIQRLSVPPYLGDLAGLNRNLNRFRSYSVNAKEKYAEEEDEYLQAGQYSGHQSGTMTPLEATTAAALVATQAQIHQHNLAVQAFANQASASRPRARTAGVLDSPVRVSGRQFLATPSRLDRSIVAGDLGFMESSEYARLPEAVHALHLNGSGSISNLDSSDDTNQESPTRALWLGNIPPSTTITSLQAIFLPFGKIDSTRVLVHKNCGFINFENMESAIQAKATLGGKEIFPGAGPVRIGFAKEPSASIGGTPSNGEAFRSASPDSYNLGPPESQSKRNIDPSNGSMPTNGVQVPNGGAALPVASLAEMRDEMLNIVREFGANNQDQAQIANTIDAAIAFTKFEPEISPVPEPSHTRIHDAPKLREIRKRIDNNSVSQTEIEEIAMGMLPEIAELASDYLGNTVVQKLFEFCSESLKEQMLLQIDPHLAEIGIHKNGTWAAQKIIDVAKVPSQIGVIVDSLRPYTVALFLDQYGNYVLQCCLRFGYPWNNFIFETMISRMWDVAQGRFGARAMRACLESHHATKDQQRLLASAIVLHSVQLATNANGALLLTWFLDTCTFPHRRAVLAPRLVQHLVRLCTHKVAYLTVLKVINQRNEPEARDIILKALFFSENDQTLEDILSDQACGATLIFKILTLPFFDEKLRSDVIQNVRNVLCRLKVSPSQGYKRLMDEVGLSARAGKADRDNHTSSRPDSRQDRQRPTSQHGNGRKHHPEAERQYSGQYFQNPSQPQFSVQNGITGSPAIDQSSISAYEPFTQTFSTSPFNSQYPQTLLASSARGMPHGDFYPGMSNAGLNGFASTAAVLDPGLRNMQASAIQQRPMQIPSNLLLQQAPFTTPSGLNTLISNAAIPGAYQYPLQYFTQQQQVLPQQSGERRGRVSYFSSSAAFTIRLTRFLALISSVPRGSGKRDGFELSINVQSAFRFKGGMTDRSAPYPTCFRPCILSASAFTSLLVSSFHSAPRRLQANLHDVRYFFVYERESFVSGCIDTSPFSGKGAPKANGKAESSTSPGWKIGKTVQNNCLV